MSEFDIGYEPRKAIKAQPLADFIQEMTINKTVEQKWLMYVDGSPTLGGSGGGIILINPKSDQLQYASKFGFRASNNEAEYEALIKEMEMAVRLGVRHLVAYCNSELISQQVEGTFEAKEDRMKKYVQEIQNLGSHIERFELHHIPRLENIRADYLSKIISSVVDCKACYITLLHVERSCLREEVLEV